MSSPTDFGDQRRAGLPQGIVVVIASFLPILAIVALAPAVPRMMEHFAGVPGASLWVPLAVTAPGLMVALLSPAMGWLVDRYGRSRLLVVATAIYGLVGIAPVFIDGLPALFASRLLLGVCEAAILTVTNTLVGDYFEEDRRRFWLTVQSAAQPFFGVSLLVLSGTLSGMGWNIPFLVYACAIPIALAMAFLLFEPAKRSPALAGLASERFPTRHVLITSGVTLLASSLYYVYIVQVGLLFPGVSVTSPDTIGMLIGLANVGVFFGGLLFKPASARLGTGMQVGIFFALLGLGLLGIGASHSPAQMTVFCAVQQLGAGLCIPTLLLWTMRGLSDENRGRGMGIWSCAFFVGQFVSPALVSLVTLFSHALSRTFVVMGVGGIILAVILGAALNAGARQARVTG
ncbi:MFS transporter [Novosphingobium sp. KACC 22771]|uniref:MFS transporter n=1 Tax=Novosphingobium sp. KACC 22771 TaxID=3025670 RepID=UPI002366A068|nr:MFS transporter [Novosphingobium sp. KACC 22771]WDF71757.1 MFS transporter [Novosphingobium sp. KACC 22771]